MPCFKCGQTYNCKYFRSMEWNYVMLMYKWCPVQYGIPFESAHQFLHQAKLLDQERSRMGHRPMSLNSF